MQNSVLERNKTLADIADFLSMQVLLRLHAHPPRCVPACAQNVLAVNLANQHGSEWVLGKAFKEQAERFARAKPGFEVVSFDFHKECGATRYDRRAIPPHAAFPASCRFRGFAVLYPVYQLFQCPPLQL